MMYLDGKFTKAYDVLKFAKYLEVSVHVLNGIADHS